MVIQVAAFTGPSAKFRELKLDHLPQTQHSLEVTKVGGLSYFPQALELSS